VHRTRVFPLVAIVAAVLALPACGYGQDEGGDYSANPVPVLPPPTRPGEPAVPTTVVTSAPAAPSPTPAALAATPSPDGVRLAARPAPGLGTVVTDAGGFTLYRFDRDTPRPPASTCVAECATAWPPVVVDPEGALNLEGVDRSAVGMVQRPDGTSQLTIGGWPVYRYAGDTAPGTTAGQGVDGAWFAVTPDGGKAG
jgi:predicted lipoprotein with Yx(FWY)xxD motif